MTVTIPFTLSGLNDYIAAERTFRQKAARMKKSDQKRIIPFLRGEIKTPLNEPVTLRYTWVEKDKRRDKDNIAGYGHKVIQDALVEMGALQNDGWKNIDGFTDSFLVDKDYPRIELEIVEAG